jgi:hypothetical protein
VVSNPFASGRWSLAKVLLYGLWDSWGKCSTFQAHRQPPRPKTDTAKGYRMTGTAVVPILKGVNGWPKRKPVVRLWGGLAGGGVVGVVVWAITNEGADPGNRLPLFSDDHGSNRGRVLE